MSQSSNQRQRLLKLIESRCLNSDAESSVYLDCKRAILHGECLDLISEAFLTEISMLPAWPDAIGGMTLSSNLIIAATVATAHRSGLALEGSIARRHPKKVQNQNLIENKLPVGTRIVIVDDVITTRSSILQAANKFQAAGYEISGVIALVDKGVGGAEILTAQLKCWVRSVFHKHDFTRVSA